MGQTDIDLTKYATVKDLGKIDLTSYVKKADLPAQQDLTTYLKKTDFDAAHNMSTGLKFKNAQVDNTGVAPLDPSYVGGFNIYNGIADGATASLGWTHFNAQNKGGNYIRGNTEFEQTANFKSGLSTDKNIDPKNTNFRVFGGTRTDVGAAADPLFANGGDSCASIIMPYGTSSIQYANCGAVQAKRTVISVSGAKVWGPWSSSVNVINSATV